MILTSRLIRRLNRVFDRNPRATFALSFSCNGSALTWTVADGILSTTLTGGTGADLAIDLSQYTLAGLAAFLGAQAGYAVATPPPAALQNLAATILLDGAGAMAAGAATLQAYTNPNWLWMDTAASELTRAANSIAQLPLLMSTVTAYGEWLDVLGDIFGRVTRQVGEQDGPYSARIIGQAVQLKCNNRAIELILQGYSGHLADVVDVVAGTILFAYDGTYEHDGSKVYAQPDADVVYGLFDVTVTYDQAIVGGTQAGFQATVTALVAKAKAAGTQMRNLTIKTA